MNTTLTSLRLRKKYKSVLIISDLHAPYQHPDALRFLKALNVRLKPDLVVQSGDEVDMHAMSFHNSEPDLDGPGPELDAGIAVLKKLAKIFPKMHILDSNHGSLIMRKGAVGMLPTRVFRTPQEILETPKTWVWSRDLTFETELGPVFCTHGKSGVAGKLSRSMAMNSVQGHYHNKFQIDYWGSPAGLFWDMHTACLVDDTSLAMAYNKTTLQRPVIGVSAVLNGRPYLVPMLLDSRGRWTGTF